MSNGLRVAIDSYVLAYAEGVNPGGKKEIAVDILQRLPAPVDLLCYTF